VILRNYNAEGRRENNLFLVAEKNLLLRFSLALINVERRGMIKED
jgi:hypothetical protein